ncbi:LacI family transcriptional regulator [Acrocarpospora pleiomorpha]|uniref:LacI family transcriptional regulator n=1 Tax=Acrocarpospora pleiomorpha TaxID=90975 RepID=A0A5M3XW14_9ACTN|nr:LacI family transcriptional regulator [Acrocarpospora pleiomorpha]
MLSGANNVSESARRAVLTASKQLGYRPNPNARAMRGAGSSCVGMIVPEIGNPFFAELIQAVELALQAHDVELIIADARNDVATEAARLRSLVARQVDGVLIAPVSATASRAALESALRTTPIVQIDRDVDFFEADFVGVDNSAGIRSVLSHLESRSVRHIVFVSGDASTSTGAARLEAFRTQAPRFPDLVVDEPVLGEFTLDFGFQAAGTLLRRPRLPQGVVCGSDLIATGLMRALAQHGVHEPDDIVVTGFDGTQLSELINPAMTTVRQPLAEIAKVAAHRLQARIGGDSGPPQRSQVNPQLVARSLR